MNLRKHKRTKLSLMHFALFGAWGPIGQFLVKGKSYAAPAATPETVVYDNLPLVSFGIKGQPLVKVFREAAGIDKPSLEHYTVVRKKDREVVGTFDTLELAQAEVDKAKRAKKAALEIL